MVDVLDDKELEFLSESNAIEREYYEEALEDAKEAWEYAKVFIPLGRKIDISMIKTVHQFLLNRLNLRIAGKIRKVEVGIMHEKGFKEFVRTLFVGRLSEQDVVRAFTNAYDNSPIGARVHTNSWGSVTHVPGLTNTCKAITGLGITYRPYDTAINQFVFDKGDTLPFFAASNTGRDFPDIIFFAKNIPLIGTVSANAFECSAYKTPSGNMFGFGNLANPGTAKNVLTVGGTEQELPNCATVS